MRQNKETDGVKESEDLKSKIEEGGRWVQWNWKDKIQVKKKVTWARSSMVHENRQKGDQEGDGQGQSR